MRDVKSPCCGTGATSAAMPSTLAHWLNSVGLNDLLGAVVYADQREPWTFDAESGPLARNVHALGFALSNAAPTNGHDQSLNDEMTADLIYLLAFLRTSQCLRLLFHFNAALPGVAEHLLTRATQSNANSSREALLLTNRLLYLIRQSTARQIFSSARRAEVLAAVAAARL
jgi:hypothetical protein